MLYVGMDISSKSFVVHAVDERKRVVLKTEIAASRESLRWLIGQLGPQPKLFVFEAGNQLKWVADTLGKQDGVSLHVVHPNEVKWISTSSGKTGQGRCKEAGRAGARRLVTPEGAPSGGRGAATA